jgi:hypothetical protein
MSYYIDYNLALITSGLFVNINEKEYQKECEDEIKKKEIWNSSFTLNEKVNTDYYEKKQDIIELMTFKKIEKEIENQNDQQTNQNINIQEEKNIEDEFINPDIFTPSELQMIFCIIPLDVVTDRITDISNKRYKIKGLKSYIFDKHMYDTLIIFNQEIQTELKSELAISFAKLILSRIPHKYLTTF